MNLCKARLLLTVLAGTILFGTTAAHAAKAALPAKPAPTKAAAPVSPVTVKLGSAMLEEYHDGDPANRTTVLRDGDVAQNVKSVGSGKKHS